jgi:hypothetical protein
MCQRIDSPFVAGGIMTLVDSALSTAIKIGKEEVEGI